MTRHCNCWQEGCGGFQGCNCDCWKCAPTWLRTFAFVVWFCGTFFACQTEKPTPQKQVYVPPTYSVRSPEVLGTPKAKPYLLHDECLCACSNLSVMFSCPEGGNDPTFPDEEKLPPWQPCIDDCRAGKLAFSAICACRAHSMDEVRACGISCKVGQRHAIN